MTYRVCAIAVWPQVSCPWTRSSHRISKICVDSCRGEQLLPSAHGNRAATSCSPSAANSSIAKAAIEAQDFAPGCLPPLGESSSTVVGITLRIAAPRTPNGNSKPSSPNATLLQRHHRSAAPKPASDSNTSTRRSRRCQPTIARSWSWRGSIAGPQARSPRRWAARSMPSTHYYAARRPASWSWPAKNRS